MCVCVQPNDPVSIACQRAYAMINFLVASLSDMLQSVAVRGAPRAAVSRGDCSLICMHAHLARCTGGATVYQPSMLHPTAAECMVSRHYCWVHVLMHGPPQLCADPFGMKASSTMLPCVRDQRTFPPVIACWPHWVMLIMLIIPACLPEPKSYVCAD